MKIIGSLQIRKRRLYLLYEKYRQLAESENNVIFGGRLGNYKYYDMDKVIEAALDKIEELK